VNTKRQTPKRARTPDAKPAETPLTVAVRATAPAAPALFSKPQVGIIAWKENFGVGVGRFRSVCCALRVRHYTPSLEKVGQVWPWGVEDVEHVKDSRTILRILERRLFKTESETFAAFKNWGDEIAAREAKEMAAQAAADAHKPLSTEKDLTKARLKVMREQYPDTFMAMDALAQAQPEPQPGAVEAVLRAYAVDMVRLHKPAKLGEVSPFETLPDDASFILELAKAYSAKSPYDAVDHEIAARWYAAGYDKMKLDEYTDAINAKTGASLKPAAMKARRLKKLRLVSSNNEGAPNREI
jgi:hypothetical protein